MRVRAWSHPALLAVGLIAGGVQVIAGVAMYRAGVYFAPWSMAISGAVLLGSLVAGIVWYRAHVLGDDITYWQAVLAGAAISVCTGVVYAAYNLVSIWYFYPNFLDDVVRARLAQTGADPTNAAAFAAMRAHVSAPGIAVPNCIRLSVLGTVLSLVTAVFLSRKR